MRPSRAKPERRRVLHVLLSLAAIGCGREVDGPPESCTTCGAIDAATPDPTGPDAAPGAVDQGWSDELRRRLHHLSVGGQLIPYRWYLALRSADGDPLTSDSYVRSFGLVPDPGHEDRLPVGFGKTVGGAGEHVGYNCFACHTSEVHVAGRSVLVEGGAPLADVFGYLESIIDALDLVLIDLGRFDAFANQVLGDGVGIVARTALFEEVTARASFYRTGFLAIGHFVTVEEGFGRADAMGRGAVLLSLVLDPLATPAAADAPAAFPPLWGTPRLAWDHYSAGVRSDLARNVAQAIGNFAPFDPQTGASEIPLDAFVDITDALTILRPPRWPSELLGAIDEQRAARGEAIYRDRCASCHGDPSATGDLEPPVIATEEVGTDPAYVDNLNAFRVNATLLGLATDTPIYLVNQHLTERVIADRFRALAVTPEEQLRYTRGRPNLWRAATGYKANPLHGVWATAPYLHNNSVPTLHDLLLAPEWRPTSFRIAPAAELDPERVGLAPVSSGGFLVDTRTTGNGNGGHLYGTDLDDADRLALLEYLKTL